MAGKLNTFHLAYHTLSSVLLWSDGCGNLAVTARAKAELNSYIITRAKEIKTRCTQPDRATLTYKWLTP